MKNVETSRLSCRWDSELAVTKKSGEIQINAVTAAPFAELFVDGQSQGSQALANPTHPALDNHHKNNGGTAHWSVAIGPPDDAAEPVTTPLSLSSATATETGEGEGEVLPQRTTSPTLSGGGSGSVQPGSNLTLICKSSNSSSEDTTADEIVGVHTIIAPGAPAAIRLYIDAPNVSKGTGSALLLDGQDVALLRAEVVDAEGNLVTGTNASSAVNVTFAVAAGPGRIIASHNGDPTCHTPNLSPWHTAFHGLVRGIVQVTHDAASSPQHRRQLRQIDLDGNQRTTIAAAAPEEEAGGGEEAAGPTPPVASINVTASSPGLATGVLSIPVSDDAATHSVLAAAANSRRSGDSEQLVW